MQRGRLCLFLGFLGKGVQEQALDTLGIAVGAGSLGWMLLLGAVMGVEKNFSWGRRLSAPLGVVLIAWGLTLAVGIAPVW